MREKTLDRLLFIFGILFMIVTSVIFALYVKTDAWYIKTLLYILVPVIFVIWYLWLRLYDDIYEGIKRIRRLKAEEVVRRDSYQMHLLETDPNLEYISRHRTAKYAVVQQQKELSLEELEMDIDQTKASIEQFTKQLNELTQLKEKYDQK